MSEKGHGDHMLMFKRSYLLLAGVILITAAVFARIPYT